MKKTIKLLLFDILTRIAIFSLENNSFHITESKKVQNKLLFRGIVLCMIFTMSPHDKIFFINLYFQSIIYSLSFIQK